MEHNDGWIKLHRKILDNPLVMKDAEHLAVWVFLLLHASHKEYNVIFDGKRTTLRPGQLITGRKSIASELGMNESKVRRILESFENDQQIDQQKTNKNRLISLLNWESYQIFDQQNDQQVTNKRPTSDQQVTTNKNIKNNKNERNIYKDSPKLNSAIESFIDYRKNNKPMSKNEIDELIKKLDEMTDSEDEKIRILNQSIKRGWIGIFPIKEKKKNQFMTAESRQYNFEELEQMLLANSEGGNGND